MARQQGHLVVVLGCGQTCVRGWRGRTIGSAKRKQGNQKVKVTDEETKENAWKEFVVSEGLFEEERAGKEQDRKRIRQRGGKKTTGRAPAPRSKTCVHLH